MWLLLPFRPATASTLPLQMWNALGTIVSIFPVSIAAGEYVNLKLQGLANDTDKVWWPTRWENLVSILALFLFALAFWAACILRDKREVDQKAPMTRLVRMVWILLTITLPASFTSITLYFSNVVPDSTTTLSEKVMVGMVFAFLAGNLLFAKGYSPPEHIAWSTITAFVYVVFIAMYDAIFSVTTYNQLPWNNNPHLALKNSLLLIIINTAYGFGVCVFRPIRDIVLCGSRDDYTVSLGESPSKIVPAGEDDGA